MDLLQWEQNPWGQEILVRISWSLFWIALSAGVVFVVAHLVFRTTLGPRIKASAAAAADQSSATASVPEQVMRHSSASRCFHWLMAVSMLVLLVTGFAPVVGIQFAWVTIHWVAGLALIACVLFHIVHASARGTLRSVGFESTDVEDVRRRIRRALGRPTEQPAKNPKYPLPNRLYHHAVVLTTVAAIGTGVLMMFRVETPFLARNPYMFAEQTWGWVYVLHGLGSVGLVTLVISHVYFAVLPEKRWMTRSMVRGWIGRDEYLEHHDPARWSISGPEPGGDTDSA
ncbi:MAG TPA: cytochrome b/b6 domain-containing protein [Acidobacteriota bacterium]|nr:cytochrome b/b6 domain-containing protein [Acidobacteriota bacterium]